jgi:hypothetical protein
MFDISYETQPPKLFTLLLKNAFHHHFLKLHSHLWERVLTMVFNNLSWTTTHKPQCFNDQGQINKRMTHKKTYLFPDYYIGILT